MQWLPEHFELLKGRKRSNRSIIPSAAVAAASIIKRSKAVPGAGLQKKKLRPNCSFKNKGFIYAFLLPLAPTYTHTHPSTLYRQGCGFM